MATNTTRDISPRSIDTSNALEETEVVSNVTQNKADEWPHAAPEEIYMFLLVLMLALSIFGIAVNFMNMFTFWKLREDEPINVNLFALALSDWFVCFTSLAVFLGTAYWYSKEMLLKYRIVSVEVVYLIVGVPHSVSVRVTVLLTATISLQRCIGVMHPLKVKSIVTFPRVKAVVVFCFVFPTLMIMPALYYVNRLEWVEMPGLNITVLRHIMTEDFYDVNSWLSTTNSVLLLLLPFTIVAVCTGIMIKHLKQTMNWRLLNANANKHLVERGTKTIKTQLPLPTHLPPAPPLPLTSAVSSRKDALILKEKRIVKLVLTVSIVFLLCYAPNIVTVALTTYTSRFNLRDYTEAQQIIGYAGFFLDTLNSSINVFVYFRHSTNYRKAFLSLFCKKNRK